MYAGAQFQNSPDPSSLPIPSFVSQSPQLSRSMDDKVYRNSPTSHIPMIPPPQPMLNTMHSSYQSSFYANTMIQNNAIPSTPSVKESNHDIFNMEMENRIMAAPLGGMNLVNPSTPTTLSQQDPVYLEKMKTDLKKMLNITK